MGQRRADERKGEASKQRRGSRVIMTRLIGQLVAQTAPDSEALEDTVSLWKADKSELWDRLASWGGTAEQDAGVGAGRGVRFPHGGQMFGERGRDWV